MKKGCAVMLLAWTLSAVGYWWLLKPTATGWPVLWAIVLGLVAMILLGTLFGLAMSLKRAAALQRQKPNEWKNGEFVAAAGWLTAVRDTLVAPLSGQPALIFQCEIKRVVTVSSGSQRSSTRSEPLLMAMAMQPCEVRGAWSSARLVGYPLLAEFKAQEAPDSGGTARMARWLLAHPPQVLGTGIAERLQRMEAIHADADGELLEVFCDEGGPFLAAYAAAREVLERDCEEAAVAHLVEWLQAQDCTITEKHVPPNLEVCAFGEWDAGTRRLDVGSGMQHLSRDLLPGSAKAAAARLVRRSLTGLLVWLLIAAAMHLLVWELAGRPWWGPQPPAVPTPTPAEAATETPAAPG